MIATSNGHITRQVPADTDIKLLNNTYQPPLNYPALTWESKWQFADRLNRNAPLQTLSAGVTQYYEDTYDSTFSSLNRIYQGYLNRWEPSGGLATAVENYTADLQTALEERFELDESVSENPEKNVDLYIEMLSADSTISALTDSLTEASEALLDLIDQSVEDLLNDLSEVTCTEAYETDMKTVIETFLLSHLAGGTLTAQQDSQMAEIAAKCRYSGGYAVVLARGFFEQEELYGQDVECEPNERGDSGKAIAGSSVNLYPNPVSRTLILDLDRTFTDAKISLFNNAGVLLNAFETKDQRTFLPVAGLPNGVYMVEIQLDGQPVMHKTFVKI